MARGFLARLSDLHCVGRQTDRFRELALAGPLGPTSGPPNHEDTMITISLIRSGLTSRDRKHWTAYLPGAMGAGWTAWEAIAAAVEVWARRGAPATVPDLDDGRPDHGSDWIVNSAIDRGPGHYYRYRVEGTNLNRPPGGDGRTFVWDLPDISSRRYEILCPIVREVAA